MGTGESSCYSPIIFLMNLKSFRSGVAGIHCKMSLSTLASTSSFKIYKSPSLYNCGNQINWVNWGFVVFQIMVSFKMRVLI